MEQSLVDLKTVVGVETLPGTVGVEGVEESVLDGRVRRGHHLIQGAEVFTDQVKDAGGQRPHLQGKTKSVCVTVICLIVRFKSRQWLFIIKNTTPIANEKYSK